MSQNRNSVEDILTRAFKIAEVQGSRYVLIDHVFMCLLGNPDVSSFLKSSGDVNYDQLLKDTESMIVSSIGVQLNNGDKPVRSLALQRVFETAAVISRIVGHEKICLPELFFAILREKDSNPVKLLEHHGLKIEEMQRYVHEYLTKDTLKNSVNGQATDNDDTLSSGGTIYVRSSEHPNRDGGNKIDYQKVVEEFCINLNKQVEKIQPVIGRDKEVDQLMQVLGRKVKSNVIIAGDPGVGKTAVIEGLVKKIMTGDVPDQLKDHTIFSMDVGTLVAGTRYRGDFEERLTNIINALKKLPKAILFIDEIHMIKGSGSGSDSSMDMGNILKPALSKGEIRVIGATTHEEFRKFFEKDRALMRRFFKMSIDEPSVTDTKNIVKKSIKTFEEYHKLKYQPEALDLVVDLAHKFINDRKFPDKAFDIIDSAGSRKKMFGSDKLVSCADIENEVSLVTRIPVKTVEVDDNAKLKTLETDLKNAIHGQDHAIKQMVDYVLMAKSGLKDENKPILSALLTGSTGTGKTETSKQLAKNLDMNFVRFDMSEFQERHSVSKFIGSPPGYAGFGEGAAGDGLLINEIEKNPNSVILFDEVEKAHPDVLNVLLQIMDYGMLTSSSGKQVNFRNSIILMSSNLGARDNERSPIGFGRTIEDNTHDDTATKDFFTPEFRGRLNFIAKFNRLDHKTMKSIVDKFITQLNHQVRERNITVELTDPAKEYIIEQAEKKNLGARPIAGLIDDYIKKPLSRTLLFGGYKEGTKIKVGIEAGQIILK